MLDRLQLPIFTSRLALRRFGPPDFDAYRSYHSRPEVYRYLYRDPPSPEGLQARFEAIVEPRFENDGDVFQLAVARSDDDTVIGEVLLKLASKKALQAEVGYILHPACAGRGFATEAAHAMIDLGFTHLGLHRIFARVDPLNVASVRVIERLGLRREAHFRQNDRFNDVWGDEFIYAVLRSEWPSVQA